MNIMNLFTTLNLAHFKTPHGIISIIRIVFDIILCGLLNAACWKGHGCMTVKYFYAKGIEGLQKEGDTDGIKYLNIMSILLSLTLLVISVSCLLAFFFLAIHVLGIPSKYRNFNWKCAELTYLIVLHVLYVMATLVLIFFLAVYEYAYESNEAEQSFVSVLVAGFLFPIRNQHIAAVIFSIIQVVLYYVSECMVKRIYSNPGQTISAEGAFENL